VNFSTLIQLITPSSKSHLPDHTRTLNTLAEVLLSWKVKSEKILQFASPVGKVGQRNPETPEKTM